MKQLLKKINNNKYLIFSLLLLVLIITIGSVFFWKTYLKLGFSLKFFFDGVVHYFQSIFKIEANNVYTPFNLIKDVKDGVVSSLLLDTISPFTLPFNLDLFPIYIREWFFMTFNINSFIDFMKNISVYASYLNFLLLFLIAFICIKIFVSSLMFNNVNPARIGYTEKYKWFENINFKFFYPVKVFFIEWFKFIRNNSFFKTYIFLFLLYSSALGVIIDSFGYFFIFSGSFKVNTIFEFVFSSLYLLFPLLTNVPLFVWLLIIYLIIDYKKKQVALNRLIRFEDKNLEFCETKLGIVNLFDGVMGGYKTSTITDFALTTSKLFRYEIGDNLYKYRTMLPFYNFSLIEKWIEYHIDLNDLQNHAQVELRLEKRFKYGNNPVVLNKNKYFFNYDFSRYKNYYFDGTKKISVEKILKEYAKNYFYYCSQRTYIYSTYPIKTIEKLGNKGYYPIFEDRYFFLKEEEIDTRNNYSHLLNLNNIRIRKYYSTGEIDSNQIISFGVCSYAEAEKDLGNQNSNRSYSIKDHETNPLNDGTDLVLKMIRHVCSLNYKPYIRFFLDMQRFGDLASKYKDISTSLITVSSSVNKNSLPLYAIENFILKLIIKLRKRVDLLEKSTRNIQGSIYYLFNKITAPIEQYYNRLINKYSYKRLTLSIKKSEDEAGEEAIYYLMFAKTFADSYRTDSHYSLFKNVMSNSSSGIHNDEVYSSLDPKLHELKAQNSYFNDKLSELFKNSEDKHDFNKEDYYGK